MAENEWIAAINAKEQLHRAYVKLTGMPIIPALKSAVEGLQNFVEAVESSGGFGDHDLERLVALHSASNAARALAAVQICEALIFRALEAGELQSRPVGPFELYATGGREVSIGLYGRARTIPTKFWERFRTAEDRQADWESGRFSFGRNKVGYAYAYAHGVTFDPSGLALLEQELSRLVGTNHAPVAALTGAEKIESGKRPGRPKGAGGFAKADAPLVEEMRAMIMGDSALTPHAAAYKVVARAPGSATDETKVRRLSEHYRRKFPAD